MFNQPTPIVGVSLGTSKVVVAVGQINDSGVLNIIGLGQSLSRGVRKGEVCDLTQAQEALREALAEAEQSANVEISSVYLGVTGGHIKGENNRGVYQVVSDDRNITKEDVEDVAKNARAINLPAGNHLLHDVRQHFSVDGRDGITDPIGMNGGLLQVDVHVVHGNFNRLQNSVKVVKALQLQVEALAFNGFASALALLTKEQKSHGALVIDIGGGTCDYAIFSGDKLRHTGVLALGGDHVTNDIAVALKIPQAQAEELKQDYGSALPDDAEKERTLAIPSDNGLPPKVINLDHLRKVMHLRLDEMLRLIYRDVALHGMLDCLGAGVIICGGGANIPKIRELVGGIFRHIPVAIGDTIAIGGVEFASSKPEFAAAIGLVKFGYVQEKRRAPTTLSKTIFNALNLFKLF